MPPTTPMPEATLEEAASGGSGPPSRRPLLLGEEAASGLCSWASTALGVAHPRRREMERERGGRREGGALHMLRESAVEGEGEGER